MTGLELKIKRIRSGRKQYEVAAALGICPTVLCDLENGRARLRPELLSRILRHLEQSEVSGNSNQGEIERKFER